MYYKLILSSVSSLRSNHNYIFGFTTRVFFRVFVARAFLLHTPPYVVSNSQVVMFFRPVLDTEISFLDA